MLVSKIFLAAAGLLYLFFAAWCAVRSTETARSIGLHFANGSGHSEYLTVYGGLQLGLGLLYLSACWDDAFVRYGLFAGLVTHAGIILLRIISLATLTGIESPTYYLAALELGLLVGFAALYFLAPSPA